MLEPSVTLFAVFLILFLNLLAIGSVLLGKSTGERKLLWTMIILLLPVMGLALYLAVGRTPADRHMM